MQDENKTQRTLTSNEMKIYTDAPMVEISISSLFHANATRFHFVPNPNVPSVKLFSSLLLFIFIYFCVFFSSVSDVYIPTDIFVEALSGGAASRVTYYYPFFFGRFFVEV